MSSSSDNKRKMQEHLYNVHPFLLHQQNGSYCQVFFIFISIIMINFVLIDVKEN